MGDKLHRVWAAAPAPRRISRFALDGEFVWSEGQSVQRLSLADGHVDATLTPGIHVIEALAAYHQRLLISGTVWEKGNPAFCIGIWAPKANGEYELQKRISVVDPPAVFLPLKASGCLAITHDGQGWMLDLGKNSLSPLALQITGVPAVPPTGGSNAAAVNRFGAAMRLALQVPRADRFAIFGEANKEVDLTPEQRVEWATQEFQRYIETKKPRVKDLSVTQVTDDGLGHIEGLAEVQYLYLDGTHITDTGLAHLEPAAQLEELSLNNTKITGAGLKHLRGLTRLRRLDLNGTQVDDAGLAYLKGLTLLRELDLSRTKVTDSGLARLATLGGLRVLDLTGDAVAGPGLDAIKGLTQLEKLNLNHTKVTDAGLKRLKGLARLRELESQHDKDYRRWLRIPQRSGCVKKAECRDDGDH